MPCLAVITRLAVSSLEWLSLVKGLQHDMDINEFLAILGHDILITEMHRMI